MSIILILCAMFPGVWKISAAVGGEVQVGDLQPFVVQVLDDYTEAPVIGAEVRLMQGTDAVESQITDESGLAAFMTAVSSGQRPELPAAFKVSENYPNPFRGETSITMTLPQERNVTTELFNVFGQRIGSEYLLLPAGIHTLHVSLGPYPAGVYFLRVIDQHVHTIKLLKTGPGAQGTGPMLAVAGGGTSGAGKTALRLEGEYYVQVLGPQYDLEEADLPPGGDTLHVALSRNNEITFVVEGGATEGTAYAVRVAGVDDDIVATAADVITVKSGFYEIEANAHFTHFQTILEIASRDTVLELEAPWIPPGDGVSSMERIAEALDAGDIDEETALVYQMLASFRDGRLPDEYRGDDSEFLSGKIQMEAMNRFDELSPEAQETIGPFLVPPMYEGSWWDLRHGATVDVGKTAAAVTPCLPREICRVRNEIWLYVANAHIKVWYRGCPNVEREGCILFNEGRESAANKILGVAAETWEKLSQLGLKTPLPDDVDPRTGAPIANHGGDARLDIALASQYDFGDYGKSFSYTPRFDETPAFMLIASGVAEKLTTAVLIHEMMHAFQFAYVQHAHPSNYDWMMEATANWAIDFVQPDNQWEHLHMLFFPVLPLILTPHLSLDDTRLRRHYSAYIWYFYLARRYDPAIVKEAFDRIHNNMSLQANELALRAVLNVDKGFEEVWPEFLVLNLNREEIEETTQYRMWDPAQPVLTLGVETAPEELSLGGLLDNQSGTLSSAVKYLSADYTHLKFTDPDIRSVAFFNGIPNKLDFMAGFYVTAPLHEEQREGLSVQALVKVQGADWELQDWTERPLVPFCRENDAENLEEVIIITGHALHTGPSENYPEATWRGTQQPTVHYSNMSCERWTGTLEGVWPGELEERVSMNVTFEALPYPDILEESAHFGYTYRLVEGTMDWQISGEQQECTVTGQQTGIPLPADRLLSTYNFVPTPGMFARQAWFNIAWASHGENAVVVTETWICGDETEDFDRTIGHFWVHITDAEVEDDGRTISGTGYDGPHDQIEWQWHFTAQSGAVAAKP